MTPREKDTSGFSAVETLVQAIGRIATIAWAGYSRSDECRDIYAICRDELRVMVSDQVAPDSPLESVRSLVSQQETARPEALERESLAHVQGLQALSVALDEPQTDLVMGIHALELDVNAENERAEAAEAQLSALQRELDGDGSTGPDPITSLGLRNCLELQRETIAILEVTTSDLKTALAKREQRLRTEWWLGHGCPVYALYGDDGEMQCNARTCMKDFKRESFADLQEFVEARRLSTAHNAVSAWTAHHADLEKLERQIRKISNVTTPDGHRFVNLEAQEWADELRRILNNEDKIS